MLHIHEVDDVELAALRGQALLLVQLVVVVEFLGERWELVVIDHHGKAFGRVLAQERLDDGEGLTRARRADHPRRAERVHDIHPPLAELTLIVVAHRDVHAVLVLYLLLALLETLVLEVEAVFQKPFLQVLGDIVESHMDEDNTHHGGYHIQPPVQCDGIEAESEGQTEEPDGNQADEDAAHQGAEHLLHGVELQMLFVARADAGHADKHECRHLAPDEVAVVVDVPPLHARVQVAHDTAPKVKHLWVDGIHEELHNHRHIYQCAEYLVRRNQVFALFHASSRFIGLSLSVPLAVDADYVAAAQVEVVLGKEFLHRHDGLVAHARDASETVLAQFHNVAHLKELVTKN